MQLSFFRNFELQERSTKSKSKILRMNTRMTLTNKKTRTARLKIPRKRRHKKNTDDESSHDDVPVASVVKNRRGDGDGSKSTQELKKIIAERERTIEKLQLELARYKKAGSRMNNTQAREELNWSAEEINFSETMNNFRNNCLFV